MPRLRLYWSVWFSIFFAFLNAQNLLFNYTKIGTEEGLNSLNIFSVNQFTNGLTCVTTDNGAYIYNGQQFRLIKNDSLKNPTVLSTGLINNHELYLLTREYGVLHYHLLQNRVKQITPSSYTNTPDALCETDQFIYLLTSEIRLDIYDKKTGKIKEDEVKLKNKNNQAYCLLKTSNGRILLGRTDGLYELKDDRQIKLNLLQNTAVYALTEDSSGNMYAGSSSRIIKIDRQGKNTDIVPVYKTQSSTFLTGGEKNITKLVIDKYNRIWFTSYPNEVLYVYDQNNTHDVFNAQNISPLLITGIFKDQQENIWISTFDDGIYIFQNSFFKNVGINFGDKTLNIHKTYFKKNSLIAATSNGLYAYETGTGTLKTVSAPDKILTEPVYDIKELFGKIYYTKRSQFNLDESRVILNGEYIQYKPVLGKLIQTYQTDKLIIADWQANVLLTGKDGLKVLDTLVSFPDYKTNIYQMTVFGDSLMIASNKGLYYHSFKNKKTELLNKNSHQRIYDITQINREPVCTREDGIYYPASEKSIKQLGVKTLSGVKKIFDVFDHLWIVTSEGLLICDKSFTPLKLYNKSNGLPSNLINDVAFSDNSVCISTPKGFSIANLSDIININTAPAQVSFDILSISNKKQIRPDEKEIQLLSDENDVAVYFHSPHYTRPVKQYFKYKINNGNWTNIENTTINLTGLSGGKHQLTIIASTDQINWSTPSEINFNKEVKFSETQYSFWIITLGIAGFLSLLSYLYIRRARNIAIKRIQEEQQINLLKHQAMNALLSPHFIFNSLTSIQNYINSNNSLKASEYLAKFSRLIRMIIEKASQREITLRDEITRLSYYLELEKERFKNKFDYTIHVDESIVQEEVKIPNMIIQPHAENCIIHGILPKMEHGQLDISFKKINGNKLSIVIEDNGIGLIKAREHAKTGHKSLGTSTIKSILELNSKLSGKTQKVEMIDKSTINANDHGTRISIELEL